MLQSGASSLNRGRCLVRVEVLFLPTLATNLPSKLCVVIDVLRATSNVVAMLDCGARRVILAESAASAPGYASSLPEPPVLVGESGGLAPAGFDQGNSPRECSPEVLRGRDVLFATSNGTRAMRLVSEAASVITGSMLNATAAVRAALGEAKEKGLDIAFVCSGDVLGTRFAIDDAFVAGYLVSLVDREAECRPAVEVDGEADGPPVLLEESAVAAQRLYRSYLVGLGAGESDSMPSREAILAAFWESHNAQVLRQVGLPEDVEYCAQIDISDRVPRLRQEAGMLVLS